MTVRTRKLPAPRNPAKPVYKMDVRVFSIGPVELKDGRESRLLWHRDYPGRKVSGHVISYLRRTYPASVIEITPYEFRAFGWFTCGTHEEIRAWPDDGPAVEYDSETFPVYRKPTLTGGGVAGPPAARHDAQFDFSYTEKGDLVSYSGTVGQDELFLLLARAGLLARRVVRKADDP